jgi:hypothetical protein
MKREYDLSKEKRGPVVPLPPEKVRITIRLDRDIVDQFRDKVRKDRRGNYQTLIKSIPIVVTSISDPPLLCSDVAQDILGPLRGRV